MGDFEMEPIDTFQSDSILSVNAFNDEADVNEPLTPRKAIRYERPSYTTTPWALLILIFGTEVSERFTWSVIRTLLVLFLNIQLGFSENASIAFFGYISALAYFMSLVGGYISDSYWGRYNTILRSGGLYIAGILLLSFFSGFSSTFGSMLGLFLIAIGTGGIKPCVSSFGADQFLNENASTQQMSQYFSIFYLTINIGSLLSRFLTPIVKEKYDYQEAFFLPAPIFGASLLLFWLGRDYYTKIPPNGSILTPFLHTIRSAGRSWWNRCILQKTEHRITKYGNQYVCDGRRFEITSWIDYAKIEMDESIVDDIKQALRIIPMLLPLCIFSALFEQQSSTWTFQLARTNLHLTDSLSFEVEQIGILNPILVIAIIPLLSYVIYPLFPVLKPVDSGTSWLEGWKENMFALSPLRKIGAGMGLAAFSFYVSWVVEILIDNSEPNSVSFLFVLPQFVIIALAETLVWTTGLEFAYSEAPPSMKGIMSSFFLLTSSAGSLLAGFMFSVISGMGSLLVLFATLMVADLACFIVLACQYTYASQS